MVSCRRPIVTILYMCMCHAALGTSPYTPPAMNRSTIVAMLNTLQSKVVALEASQSVLESKMSSQDHTISAQELLIQNYQTQLQNQQTINSQILSRMAAQEGKIEQNKQQMDRMQQELDSEKQKVLTLEARILVLENKNNPGYSSPKNCSCTMADMAAIITNVIRLDTRITSQQQEIDHTKNVIDQQEALLSLQKNNTGDIIARLTALENNETKVADNVNKQFTMISSIQSNLSKNSDRPVAFAVYLSHHLEDRADFHIIKFDGINQNIGGHYNIQTGVFTSPANGSYVFSVNLYLQLKNYVLVRIMKNNLPVAWVNAPYHQNQFDTISTSTVISLEQGDRVWIRIENPASVLSVISYESSFSGFLL